jgi:alanyl-tRNA synthetase
MFPELGKREKDIKQILSEEEESFSRTLDRGEKIFQEYAEKAKKNGSSTLSGADVWRLYDTYGFPVDLTRIMAGEAGLDISEDEFAKAQADAKQASKAKKTSSGVELVKLDVHDIGKLESMASVPKTDDRYKYGISLNIDSWRCC